MSVHHKSSMNWEACSPTFHFQMEFLFQKEKSQIMAVYLLYWYQDPYDRYCQEISSCILNTGCLHAFGPHNESLYQDKASFEGELGPPTTLVQAIVTEAEKQMLYELERTAEEEKNNFLIPKYRM